MKKSKNTSTELTREKIVHAQKFSDIDRRLDRIESYIGHSKFVVAVLTYAIPLAIFLYIAVSYLIGLWNKHTYNISEWTAWYVNYMGLSEIALFVFAIAGIVTVWTLIWFGVKRLFKGIHSVR